MKYVFILLFTFLFDYQCCIAQNFTLQDTTLKQVQTLVTYNIQFEIAKSTLKEESYLYLDTIVIFLQRNNNLVMEVGNYFDERWSAESSRCLTCLRADKIVEYLISKGIDSDRLTAVGYDDSNPIIKNAKTEDEHLVNRRTEFKILRTDFEE
ncbi:MAG: OmpA family protein [Bacteroidetes bacterium]|jgi:peptidoglycan-associated lipoprotein|nr:OmpA family protein [Bacteroidota bacterium]